MRGSELRAPREQRRFRVCLDKKVEITAFGVLAPAGGSEDAHVARPVPQGDLADAIAMEFKGFGGGLQTLSRGLHATAMEPLDAEATPRYIPGATEGERTWPEGAGEARRTASWKL